MWRAEGGVDVQTQVSAAQTIPPHLLRFVYCYSIQISYVLLIISSIFLSKNRFLFTHRPIFNSCYFPTTAILTAPVNTICVASRGRTYFPLRKTDRHKSLNKSVATQKNNLTKDFVLFLHIAVRASSLCLMIYYVRDMYSRHGE